MAQYVNLRQSPLPVPKAAQHLENFGASYSSIARSVSGGSHFTAEGPLNRKVRRAVAKQDRKASDQRPSK